METPPPESAADRRNRRDHIRAALDAAAVGTWVWNLRTQRIFIDSGMARLLHIGPRESEQGELDIAQVQAAIHRDDRRRAQVDLDRALSGAAYVSEFRLERGDGSTCWVIARGQLEYDAAGRPARLSGALVDISERKRSEDALRFLARAGRLLGSSLDVDVTLKSVARLAIESIADVCLFDLIDVHGDSRRVACAHRDPAQQRKLETNPRFLSSPAHLQQPLVQRMLAGESIYVPRVGDAWLHAMTAGDTQRAAREHQVKSLLVVPVAAEREVLGGLVLCRLHANPRLFTETERHLAEELGRRAGFALRRALLHREVQTANRRKDEFLATLAHELRNPLAPLTTALEVLQRTDDPAVLERTRGLMERQVRQMSRLIEDLLDLSRAGLGKISLRKERINLVAAVSQAVETTEPVIAANNQNLTVTLPAAPILLDADPARLTQVFVNLLTNAAKFTTGGGHIWLTVEDARPDAIVSVRDDGIGIPPNRMAGIFEMFAQVKNSAERTGGLGIGLALVRRLIDMHGGVIEAHSEGTGHGSEFIVRLPRVAEEAAPLYPPAREPSLHWPQHAAPLPTHSSPPRRHHGGASHLIYGLDK
ncbi:MAG TPA: ATP-binding protein [Gammaproteobacteria bacterium]|nr:ATP-binding protein [Gammaproteobacteria bacterium]